MAGMPRTPETTEPSRRADLVEELGDLTLPLMWELRQAAMRAFEPFGVRPVKALLLTLIVKEPRYPKDLSEVLDTVPPVISSLVGDLEKRGLIERVPDREDRRRVRLAATQDGIDLSRRMASAWHDVAFEGVAALSEEELATLVAIYRRVLANR